jgi:hypothetical protein
MQKKLTIESNLISQLNLERNPRKWVTEWAFELKKDIFNVETPGNTILLLKTIEDCLPFFRFSKILGNFFKDNTPIPDFWDQSSEGNWQDWCQTSKYEYDSSPQSKQSEVVLILTLDLLVCDEHHNIITLKDWTNIHFVYDNRIGQEAFTINFILYAASVLFENEKYKENNLNILSKGFKKLRKKWDAQLIIDNVVPPLDKGFLEA